MEKADEMQKEKQQQKTKQTKHDQFSIAALQMSSTDDVTENLQIVKNLLAIAKQKAIDVVVLPENFAQMPKSERQRLDIAEEDGKGEIQEFLATQANLNNVWIIAGTIPLLCSESDKVFASCLVYDNHGARQARYDKIHLFDVVLNNGKRYAESDGFIHGAIDNNIQAVETPWGKIGLSVCYDIRFPELYRALSEQDVAAFVVPSAFTYETGESHWELLLRARAVENMSYVIGAGQFGKHANGRSTWGHSMIVDPWGNVMAMQSEGQALVSAEIKLDTLKKLRQGFPCLSHKRL